MALISTPTYSQGSVSGGIQTTVPCQQDYFCSGTSADAYPADPTNAHYNKFGFQAATVILTNESGNDLVYQWLNQAGSGFDSGVVKANSTLVIRQCFKQGILIRSRTGSSAAAWILSAV